MFDNILFTTKVLFSQIVYKTQHKFAFQAPASANFERIIDLHHFIFFYLIVILIIVVWLLLTLIDNFSYFNNINNFKNYKLFNVNNILNTYTYKFIDKYHLNYIDVLTLINVNNSTLDNSKKSNLIQNIGLNEHFNLYIKSIITFLIIDNVF